MQHYFAYGHHDTARTSTIFSQFYTATYPIRAAGMLLKIITLIFITRGGNRCTTD